MNSEIIEVPVWIHAWCDMATGMPLQPLGSSPTGTPADMTVHDTQFVIHYIEVGKRLVHVGCGGDVVSRFDTRWETSTSYTKWWLECSDCHERFDETDYE